MSVHAASVVRMAGPGAQAWLRGAGAASSEPLWDRGLRPRGRSILFPLKMMHEGSFTNRQILRYERGQPLWKRGCFPLETAKRFYLGFSHSSSADRVVASLALEILQLLDTRREGT